MRSATHHSCKNDHNTSPTAVASTSPSSNTR